MRENQITSLEEVFDMLEGDDPDFIDRSTKIIQGWIERGDGVAVYENQDLGSPDVGHKQFVSFGSEKAQLPGDIPPDRLPDIGGAINFRYWLKGFYRNIEVQEEI
jgi:hypothetical protein